MPELSQDAIHELRQSLPMLERLKRRFSSFGLNLSGDEFMQLRRALEWVQSLTGREEFLRWVGSIPSPTRPGWDERFVYTVEANHVASAERLYTYVQGILQAQELEETLNRLTEENASQKEQLAELRRRELTYLTMLGEAQTATAYSPPPDSNKILLASLERQRAIITKNLGTAQEQKAQYGLDPPLHLLNTIDQLQEDLKAVDNSLGYLKANITEMK
jgi:hypothetical protein